MHTSHLIRAANPCTGLMACRALPCLGPDRDVLPGMYRLYLSLGLSSTTTSANRRGRRLVPRLAPARPNATRTPGRRNLPTLADAPPTRQPPSGCAWLGRRPTLRMQTDGAESDGHPAHAEPLRWPGALWPRSGPPALQGAACLQPACDRWPMRTGALRTRQRPCSCARPYRPAVPLAQCTAAREFLVQSRERQVPVDV